MTIGVYAVELSRLLYLFSLSNKSTYSHLNVFSSAKGIGIIPCRWDNSNIIIAPYKRGFYLSKVSVDHQKSNK